MAEPISRSHHIQACAACVKAKRKCSRQSPACLRCRSRGLDCQYSTKRYSHWVLLPETPPETSSEENTPPRLNAETALRGLDPLVSLDEEKAHAQLSSWFTSIHTWDTVRSERLEMDAFSSFDLGGYVRKVRGWLAEWVQTGGNPFIHPRVYSLRFPRNIQDAYMCLSCFLNKTPANEQLVMRLVEERSQVLLNEHGFDTTGSFVLQDQGNGLDLMGHIARVQALLVYQFIGLFEDKVSLRPVAQNRNDLMLAWTKEMVSAAANTVPSGVRDILASSEPGKYYGKDFMQLLWHSWIVSETVRRTWNVMATMLGLFGFVKGGRRGPCPGGMMFTTRIGVWEAETATEWLEICSSRSVGLMQVAEACELIYSAECKQINEFATTTLELTYGRERVQQWRGFNSQCADSPRPD
ncbi:Zn(II)2Cys6 transcription factor domain-containing protein [Aspergillus lucknowensis]|uniref:Zn(2)-C6 fungal-type domain-containing protein n=1 Tax=Aspergillus lucknowensis TaxID=176173 RepID=A0ABR4L611_9EURO